MQKLRNFAFSTTQISWLIFMGGLCIFLLGIPHYFFVRGDCRYAVFALDMYQHGITLFPSLYGQAYPDYTIIQTLLSYVVMTLTRNTSTTAMLLPVSIISALILVQTYKLGALYSKQWGILAIIFLLLTSGFFTNALSLGGDQFVVSATLLGFYCVYVSHVFQKPQYLWGIPAALIFGFLFRGVLGAFIPALAMASFYFFERRYKLLLIFCIVAGIVVTFCIGGLLFSAYLQGGIAFLQETWWMEYASRIQLDGTSSVFHFSETRNYFIDAFTRFALSAPIALIVLLGIFKKLWRAERGTELHLLKHLALAAMVILWVMAIPGSRKLRYVIAITPALSLIAAYLFLDKPFKPWLLQFRQNLMQFVLMIPVLLVVIMTILWFIRNDYEVISAIHFSAAFAWSIALTGMSILIWKKRENTPMTSLWILLGMYLVLNFYVVYPALQARQGTLRFIEQINRDKNPTQKLVFYKMDEDMDVLNIVANIRPYTRPNFLKTQEQLLQLPSNTFVITEAGEKLPSFAKIVYQGEITGTPCVIFKTHIPVPLVVKSPQSGRLASL